MRWVWRVVVAVGVGVVVNVGVAWSFAAWVPVPVPLPARADDAFTPGLKEKYVAFRGQGFEYVTWRSVSRSDLQFYGSKAEQRAPAWTVLASRAPYAESSVFEQGSGWPALSMRSCFVISRSALSDEIIFQPPWAAIHCGSRKVGPGWTFGHVRELPVLPIWRGLVVNTVVYAAVAMGVMVGPGWVVRGRRRRRGLCVWCGYAKGDSEVCSECGKGRGAACVAQAVTGGSPLKRADGMWECVVNRIAQPPLRRWPTSGLKIRTSG
jgi:hypothetical protein